MAANQLDDVWNNQISVLNQSYVKTLDLLDAGKDKEAYNEFHTAFVPAVKKLFSEASTTSPDRFKSAQDWCAWIKGVYVTTIKADRLLATSKAAEARPLLDGLHQNFYDLHNQINALKANDLAYALHAQSMSANLDPQKFKALTDQLATAKLPANAMSSPENYKASETAFTAKVTPILKDTKVDEGELSTLRSATDSLYKTVGRQLE